MNRHTEYYVFARPNGMEGHRFTDDVAICKAGSLGEAKRIFSKYYADLKDEEVWKLSGTLKGKGKGNFTVLTDY